LSGPADRELSLGDPDFLDDPVARFEDRGVCCTSAAAV
jgi:hypothetical protein